MDNKTISDIALDSLNNMNHMNKISSLYSQLLVLRTIKLYGSKSIQDLLQGLNKAVPLAVDNWELIQKIISNQKK